MFEEIKDYSALDWGKFLLVIGLVLLIGLFIVNQFGKFMYSTELLSTPCDLCLKINENVDLCPRQIAIEVYPNNVRVFNYSLDPVPLA